MQSVCPRGSWTGPSDRSPFAAASAADSPAVAQAKTGLTYAKSMQLKGKWVLTRSFVVFQTAFVHFMC